MRRRPVSSIVLRRHENSVSGAGCNLCAKPSEPRLALPVTAGSFKSSQGSRTPPKAPASDTRFLGVVQVLVEVTDKGYVCDFRVVHALNQDADNQVKEAVRNWHFTPAKKNGRGVPITALVEVDVWRNSKGEIVLQKPADDRSEERRVAKE